MNLTRCLRPKTGQNSEPEAPASASEELVDLSVANSEPPAQEVPEWSENIPNELPVDTRWDDVYSSLPATAPDEEFDPLSRSRQGDSLQDHLEWQLNMMPLSDRDRIIGLSIIEATNPDGYLTCSVEDIFESFKADLEELDIDEVAVVQHQIQHLDPVSCASQNLQECLLVQLQQLPETTPFLNVAGKLIEQHLKALGTRDYAQIMRKGKLKEGQLREALKLIQSLNPKPGATIDQGEAEYVIPDISVSRQKDRWVVELNSDSLPKLRINNSYAGMVQRANTSRDNMFMKNHLQEARWFLKNIQSRNETLLKVASKIVSFQQAFFEQGEEAMKPLILADIAKAVDMHESTISRVTTQKYMHTPRGCL